MFIQSKENEMLQKPPRSSTTISQSDFVDEMFYHRLEERAKKADQDRREAARRARDYYHRENLTLDTNDQQLFTMEPILLNREEEIPAFPLVSCMETEKKAGNTDAQRS